jgi:adenosine deaminase
MRVTEGSVVPSEETLVSVASVRALPKAEVHVHLEGCFAAEELVDLAAAASVSLPRPVDELFSFAGLDDFLDFLDWACGLVRTADQVARAAYRFCERETASGVRYADVIVNPTHWGPWRDRIGDLVDALDAGFSEAEQDGLCAVGLCLSILRQQSASEANELVDLMIDDRHPRVVALSVDGNETAAGRSSPRFAEAFRRAGRAGFGRTVHSGESGGPDGMWDALELLGTDRFDHGVRAVEDAELVKVLADRRVPLGICPSSNVTLGLYAGLADHPLDGLRLAGVPVSVNTDDPGLLDVRLDEEYVAAATAFGWDRGVVAGVARMSIEASFADPDRKRSLLAELDGT